MTDTSFHDDFVSMITPEGLKNMNSFIVYFKISLSKKILSTILFNAFM